jgi:hypothetical protein
MSMTIFAIAGTVLIRSMINSIDASRMAKDLTKAIFLTKYKLHEFEVAYNRKANFNQIGEYRGEFVQEGAEDYYWNATVDLDDFHDAFVIRVTVGKKANRTVSRFRDSGLYTLQTMVPAARFNQDLVEGIAPGKRTNRSSSRGRSSRGGRGGSRGGGRR